uniref:Uncharacterized protein n=1 Tax=Anguilla anguilla TaxID=7936 RepID=A0A0E9VQ12_ANGAN
MLEFPAMKLFLHVALKLRG